VLITNLKVFDPVKVPALSLLFIVAVAPTPIPFIAPDAGTTEVHPLIVKAFTVILLGAPLPPLFMVTELVGILHVTVRPGVIPVALNTAAPVPVGVIVTVAPVPTKLFPKDMLLTTVTVCADIFVENRTAKMQNTHTIK
jgi:hypothetical protein